MSRPLAGALVNSSERVPISRVWWHQSSGKLFDSLETPCQRNSHPKSSPPPSKASSTKRPASTAKLPNSGRCLTAAANQPPRRRKRPPASARNSALPQDEKWRWHKRQDGQRSGANLSHQRQPRRKPLNKSAGSAKKVWQGSSPPRRSGGVYRRLLRRRNRQRQRKPYPPGRRPLELLRETQTVHHGSPPSQHDSGSKLACPLGTPASTGPSRCRGLRFCQ